MALNAGAFGCSVTLKSDYDGTTLTTTDPALLDITRELIKLYAPYFFFKGFRTKAGYDAELKNIQTYVTWFFKPKEESAKNTVLYLQSIFGLPYPYGVKIPTEAIESQGCPGVALYSEEAGKVNTLMMRNLGQVFKSLDDQYRPLSFSCFYNFLQKLKLLNFFLIHDDLHQGNITYNDQFDEINIIDLGGAYYPYSSLIEYRPDKFGPAGYWAKGIENYLHLSEDEAVNAAMVNLQGSKKMIASDGSSQHPLSIYLSDSEFRAYFAAIYKELNKLKASTESAANIKVCSLTRDFYSLSHFFFSYNNWFLDKTFVKLITTNCLLPHPWLRPMPSTIIDVLDKICQPMNYRVTLSFGERVLAKLNSRTTETLSFNLQSALELHSSYESHIKEVTSNPWWKKLNYIIFCTLNIDKTFLQTNGIDITNLKSIYASRDSILTNFEKIESGALIFMKERIKENSNFVLKHEVKDLESTVEAWRAYLTPIDDLRPAFNPVLATL